MVLGPRAQIQHTIANTQTDHTHDTTLRSVLEQAHTVTSTVVNIDQVTLVNELKAKVARIETGLKQVEQCDKKLDGLCRSHSKTWNKYHGQFNKVDKHINSDTIIFNETFTAIKKQMEGFVKKDQYENEMTARERSRRTRHEQTGDDSPPPSAVSMQALMLQERVMKRSYGQSWQGWKEYTRNTQLLGRISR